MKTGKRLFVIITMGLLMNSFQSVAQTWKPLGNGVPNDVKISCLDSNNNLYVVYTQDTVLNFKDTLEKITVAKWDGSYWTKLKPFVSWFKGSTFYGMAFYKGQLFLAGTFDSIIGLGVIWGTIRFNGTNWTYWPGSNKVSIVGDMVHDMVVFKDKLYISGEFKWIDGIVCNNIACWDGATWQPLGNIGSEGVDHGILQMKLCNKRLFVCGDFERIGSINETCALAEWDGNNWSVFKPKPTSYQSEFYELNYYKGRYYGIGLDSLLTPKRILMEDSLTWINISKNFDVLNSDRFWSWNTTIVYQDMIWAIANAVFSGDPNHYQVIIWNGKRWIPYIGMNLKSNNYINHLYELGGKLIVTGHFDSIAGVPCNNIAYFNSSISNISGNVFYDKNSNCKKDINEPGLSSFLVEIQPGPKYVCTDINGNYNAYVDIGSYSVRLLKGLGKYKYWYLSACNPGYYNINIGTVSVDSNNNFGYVPKPNIEDLRLFIVGQTGFGARPGRTESYSIDYENIGTKTISSGTVNLRLDNRVVLKTSIPNYDSYTHPNLTWSFSDLKPLEKRTIRLMIKVDSSISVNDTIIYTASILPLTGDSDITNNYDTLKQRIVTAIDPNDKQCSPDGNILPQTSKIDYLIRFQNTGNHVAYRVRVIDTVTEKLPLTKVFLKTSSHPYELTVKDNVITWTFNDIMLADSTSDEPNSHGYISYTAFIKPGLGIGTKITNKAYIYFDYQSPVITNAAENIIALPVSIDEHAIIETTEYKVYPNPSSDCLIIEYLGKSTNSEIILFNTLGKVVMRSKVFPNYPLKIDTGSLPSGIYFLKEADTNFLNKIIITH